MSVRIIFRARGTGGSGLRRSLSPALAGFVVCGGVCSQRSGLAAFTLGFMLSVCFADSSIGFLETRNSKPLYCRTRQSIRMLMMRPITITARRTLTRPTRRATLAPQ